MRLIPQISPMHIKPRELLTVHKVKHALICAEGGPELAAQSRLG